MITVQPAARAIWGLRITLVVAAAAVPVRHAVLDPDSVPDALIRGGVFFALGLLVIELLRRNRRVTADDTALTVRTVIGQSHRINRSSIHVAYFIAEFEGINDPEASRLVLRDSEDDVLLLLDSSWWNPAQIAQLASTIDGLITLPNDLSRKQLIAHYPQVTKFGERRPWAYAAIWIAVAAVFSIAVVSALSAIAP